MHELPLSIGTNDSKLSKAKGEFDGFERPDASFIMCPNEFLDLLIPNCSRGCIRLVSHVLYETLRWINEDGTPNTQEISIPFSDLVRKAGISRGAARQAKEEAIQNEFLKIVTAGCAKSKGDNGSAATVSLKWSISERPARTISEFKGFYAGTGNFTAMPHSYFSRIIPTETISAIRFVSIVFRFTEGYQTQFGRRKSIPLSFRNIHKLANIRSPSVLSQTIKHCLQSNYVQPVSAGNWTPGKEDSMASVYGPKYATPSQPNEISSKTEAGHRFINRSPVGSKTEAANAFKNRSPIKKAKNILQTKSVDGESQKLLVAAGFESRVAREIASKADREVIANQIKWMCCRKNVDKPLGFLKKAIEQNWDEPPEFAAKAKIKAKRKHDDTLAKQRSKQDKAAAEMKRQRSIRKKRLLTEWGTASLEERASWISAAAQRQSAEIIRNIIRKQTPASNSPSFHVLDELARDVGLPTVSIIPKSPKAEISPA